MEEKKNLEGKKGKSDGVQTPYQVSKGCVSFPLPATFIRPPLLQTEVPLVTQTHITMDNSHPFSSTAI